MAKVSAINYASSGRDASLEKIKDVAVSAGWSVWDDMSGETNPYYVLVSTGESGTELPCYLKLQTDSADTIRFEIYTGWNNSTHSGGVVVNNSTVGQLDIDDDSAHYISVICSKDIVAAETSVGTSIDFICCTIYTSLHNEPKGVLQSSATTGLGVTVQLDTGEADGFVVGSYYSIIDLDGNAVNYVSLSNVDKSLDQVTISTLANDMAAGSTIGVDPHHWVLSGSYYNSYGLLYDSAGTGAINGSMTQAKLFNLTSGDPDDASKKYQIFPISLYEANSNIGYFQTLGEFPVAAAELSTLGVAEVFSGTATSATADTLTLSTASWSTNEFLNKAVVITGGTGAGQARKILSNTGTTISCTVAWDVQPNNTSTFVVCDECWRYIGTSSYKIAVWEI